MQRQAWDDISALVAAAPYPVEVLPVDAGRASACLAALGLTERSWLGAVVARSGGLVVDHGWLRVLGGGYEGLPDVVAGPGRLGVGFDVLGGQFAVTSGGGTPTVHYFAPDDLAWEDLELGYGDWLEAMLAGSATDFYQDLRWPGWAAEVSAVPLDQGIHTWPPTWTAEGKDLAAVSRRAIPLAELVAVHHDAAAQVRPC